MNIKIINDEITTKEIAEIAKEFYGTMIKGVVDIKDKVVALGGEYHIDANLVLLEKGSKQSNIWGFNINFTEPKDSESWIEYISLINIRPLQNNRGMEIENQEIRQKMRKILEKIIK